MLTRKKKLMVEENFIIPRTPDRHFPATKKGRRSCEQKIGIHRESPFDSEDHLRSCSRRKDLQVPAVKAAEVSEERAEDDDGSVFHSSSTLQNSTYEHSRVDSKAISRDEIAKLRTNGVVKISNSSAKYHYMKPWSMDSYISTGSGFIIDNRMIVTNVRKMP